MPRMTQDVAAQFFRAGWVRFPHDPAVAAWAATARPVAEDCIANPQHRARWLRCGGTWFAGVSVFPNDASGAVPGRGVPPLGGAPVRFVAQALGLSGFDWDPAQVSACFSDYPQPTEGESEAAFRFRRDRDAAHVDGLTRFDGRRRPGERHGFILGLPLSDSPAEAAPLVVWEGSHEIVRRTLGDRLAGVAPERWAEEDVTDAYVAARREAFGTCRRVVVHASPGSAWLVHRLALHGVAPWRAGDGPPRIVAYFRPDPFPNVSPEWWLDRP
ncbi:MAG TPA: hypothetical protein VFJ13_00890 [Paracoccaceae bacterium]|nr:hypothetical protein [Paracoccaceae bacterium]